MTLMVEPDTMKQVVELHVQGKLDREDYDQFLPTIENMIREHGRVRLLVTLDDFEGWTAGALWEDLKFDVRHLQDIEKFGVVGEKEWEKGMTRFCKPFMSAEVRFFTPDQLNEARRWVLED